MARQTAAPFITGMNKEVEQAQSACKPDFRSPMSDIFATPNTAVSFNRDGQANGFNQKCGSPHEQHRGGLFGT